MTTEPKILLMTSTIAPSADTFLLAVADPQKRLEQYKTSARFYFSLLRQGVFDHIVYMDNSGYPLDELIEISRQLHVEDRIEFLSYQQTLSSRNSRYFLELHLIDKAMKESRFISSYPDAIIWKVTGRYLVLNAEKIVRSWPLNADIYIHHRDVPSRVVDFFFFGFRSQTYGLHIGRDIESYAVLEDGEKILRERIDALVFSGVRFSKRFKWTPRLVGTRGFDGMNYNGFRYRIKYAFRVVANLLLPRWWI